MKLNPDHIQAIVETVRDISYGRVTIEINETSQTVDIVAEKRIRLPKDSDPTPRAGKVIRVGLNRDVPHHG